MDWIGLTGDICMNHWFLEILCMSKKKPEACLINAARKFFSWIIEKWQIWVKKTQFWEWIFFVNYHRATVLLIACSNSWLEVIPFRIRLMNIKYSPFWTFCLTLKVFSTKTVKCYKLPFNVLLVGQILLQFEKKHFTLFYNK